MLCWAASAADILAAESGRNPADIYRSITEASGNTPGYVESALSWYRKGANGELRPQVFDGCHTVSRSGFESVEALAASLAEALKVTPAVSAMLYACGDGQGMGHAVTVYQSEYEGGKLYLTYADSADGVQGLRRAEVLASASGLVLQGTDSVISSLAYLGDDPQDEAPAAPVGGIMHTSPYLTEYTDMAENRGVYRFAYSPSVITYRNGEPDYSLSVTPDYSSVADMGCYTLLHNGSTQMTVEHNGIMNGSTYTGRYVGEYAQKYSVAGIRNNKTFTFGTNNPYVPTHDDYRIERLTRLVTDTNAAAYSTDETLLSNLEGVTVYRVGAGVSGYYDTAGNYHQLSGAWGSGMTAGITSLMEQIFYNADTGIIGIQHRPTGFEQTSSENPLPSVGLQGDSGSPVFIYNEETLRMELVATLANADTTVWQAYYSPRATDAVDEYCTTTIATATDYQADALEATTFYISGAKVGEDDTLIQDGEAATHLRKGTISLNGETVATYNGVALEEFSQGTWKKLDADSLTWYTYSDDDYLNVVSGKATDANTFGTDDLFYTSNLLFKADAADGSATAHRRIELTENVDLGIGHVQFSLGEGTTAATYELGQSSSDKFLSSAGFVVDKGVTLNNYFTYEKGRELRRVGEGTMNMMGTGNNDVLLNIGGGGVTHLDRTGGYAAYSALVNSRAVLKLADVGQVYNNVTLGANGGVLDFNGNDYRWTSGGARAVGSDGKTYFGLTVYEGLNRVETSTLANYAAGTTTTITIERGDDFEFVGAFRDGSTYTGSGSVEMDSRYTMMPSLLIGQYRQFTAADRQDSDSTLKVIYNGGGTMAMTGVYTLLTGDSGFEVASGTVSLHGTNTIHAIGSETGTNTNRLQNADDWHYAMAEMNVKVGSGATFELGDHALLIGDVQVEAGGSFVMKQAVHSRYEYVEGWVLAEDTYALADYYGLKGNVNLAAGAGMALRFDEGVASKLSYGGNIRGAGSLTVSAGEGSVYLTGQNSFSGEKTVASGNLRLAAGAEGDTSTHRWKVEEQASLALDSVSTNAALEARVDAASTGVLALTQDFAEQVSLRGLIVGAAEGETVHYGTADASLQASAGRWTLGGGGGTLLVDFKLDGANKLVLGNAYGTGSVVLTNAANSFSGGIEIAGGVTLGYTHTGALGNNVLSLGYGRTLAAVNGATFASDKLDSASAGVFALSGGEQNYDLSGHASLSLGAYGEATLTGALTVADGAAYRLGGAGTLTVATSLSGNHGILVDGQGSTGSRVILAAASADTGAVVVQGYDAAKVGSGDVTLTLAADNALANASSVALQNNAGLDLNGTNQSFRVLAGDASSLVYDNKGGNTLTFTHDDTQTLGVRVQAAGTDVVKSGSGTLVLTGEKLWKSLSIQSGTVQVADGRALGYLASGSQGIAVNVSSGASLHVTADTSADNTFNIAGYGVNGSSGALRVDGYLNGTAGVLNVVDDAAISGRFSFGQLNLQGHELTVKGNNNFMLSGMTGGGGRLVLEGGNLNALHGSDYTVSITGGGSANIDNYNGGATIGIELNNGWFNAGNGSFADHGESNGSTFAGDITVGAAGGYISNSTSHGDRKLFNLTGTITGDNADSTLTFWMNTINVKGTMALAGTAHLNGSVVVGVMGDASVGRLTGTGRMKVDGGSLALTATGTNLSGALELVNGGQLQLQGLAGGASLGHLSTLNLGSDGRILLSSLAGYGSGEAMMHIGTLSGTGKLLFDASELSTLAVGTYHLLTSGSQLTDFLSLADGLAGGRRELSLTSTALGDGSYALDLTVGEGQAAQTTWKGTGTLVAGTANAANITSSVGDSTFMAMDSLTISSDAGAHDTLTLSGDILATSVTYTGAGRVTLAQENGGKFAKGQDVVVDGTGTLALGDTQAISGEIELRQGTLSASSTSLNGTEGVRVTGDASFELTSASHVTAGIAIEQGKSLTVSFLDGSMADEWGGNLDDNLSGEGKLVVNLGTGTKGTGNELHLNGDHAAFTGDIEVQSGTLQLGLNDNGTLLGSTLGAKNISIAGGATLALSSTATTLAAELAWADGATLQVKDGASGTVAYTLSGKQTLGGALNIVSTKGRAVHLSGDIVGAGSLHFRSGGEGEAHYLLSGNNSYSGGTTIERSGLTVYAGGKNAFGTGAINLKNGTLSWMGVGEGWDGDLAASSIVLSGGIIDTNGYDVAYNGKVSGSSDTSFTKTGAGTLKLTQFTYSGQTHVQAGTLELDPYDIYMRSNVSGAAGATLKLKTDYYGTVYLMGTTGGEMGLELHGHYAMSGTMGHTGGTELVSGTLQVANTSALKSGSLYAHEGTTVSFVMEGNYMIAGDSAVDKLAFISGSTVQVGTEDAVGHLSFNSLEGPASFLLDIFSADSYDRLSGTLTPGSLLEVNLKASELGSYLLVEGDNSGVDTSAFTYSGNTNSEYIYLWSSSERGITLSIESASIAADANVWTGGSSTWNASGQGWYGNNFSADKKALVIAHDNTAIKVGAAVSTTTLETEVDEGVTLSFRPENGGAISATTLQKDGAGTLSFESGMGNSFGSVVVNEGTLSFSAANGNPLGTTRISGNGTFELTGGSLTANMGDGKDMTVTNIHVVNGALLSFNSMDTATKRNILIAGENSSLNLGVWANLNASSVILRDGGIIRSGDNGFGNDGGTIYVDGAGVIQYGNTGGGNLAASISGTGTLKVQDWNLGHWVSMNGVVADDKAAGSLLALELSQNDVVMNAVNSYSGGTTISAGTVIAQNASSLGSGSLHMTGGKLTLETTFRNTAYSTDLTIGSLSGTGGSIELGGNTLHINQSGSGTYAGSISGAGAVTKAGAGTLTLSGTNSIGSVNLQEGRLVAASNGALSSGTVTFSQEASLYVANNATVSAGLAGGNYLIGAEAGEAGSFSGNAAASLLASGFTKEGAGKVTVVNSSGQNPAGAMVVSAGTLAYDAGSSSTLGAVSGSGTFTLVGGAVNADNINVGKLEVSDSILAYSSTFDGKALEVSGQGAELRMGHRASVNNSTLLLKDGGQLSMSSSGFNNSTVTVEGSGILAVGETASRDENPRLDVESSISGNGTLYVTNYGTLAYTVNLNKEIADGAEGALALTTDQSDLHFKVANSYSGGTTINGGKAVAEVAGALGSGAVTVNGGELVAQAVGSIGEGDVTMNGGKLTLDLESTVQTFDIGTLSGTGGMVDIGGKILIINQTENGRYEGSFSGTGNASVLKRGDATLELGGSASSVSLQIDGGTVKLVDSDVFATDRNMSASVVTMNGGTFDINGQTSGAGADCFMFDVDSGFIDFVGAGDMLVTDSSTTAGSGLGFNAASSYAYTVVRHKGTGRAEIAADIVSVGTAGIGRTIGFSVQGSGDLVLSGDIGADLSVAEHHQFGLSKTGSGTMILSGNNGYTGGTSVQVGTLIAVGDSALGTGALSVSSGARLEIAQGSHIALTGDISFADGAALELNSVDGTQATLATTGAVTLGGSLALTINAGLEGTTTYKVLSGAAGLSAAGVDSISVNYLGDGRYNYSTRLDSTTLYLDATQDANTTLVWDGTAANGSWDQSSQNTNWNRADAGAADTSFMNQDSVSFTETAGNKNVAVAEAGVRVESLSVSGVGYSFSGGTVQAEVATLNEAVTLTGGASLKQGEAFTVSHRDATDVANIGPLKMGGYEGQEAVAYLHGMAKEGLTRLDNTVIDIAKGAVLELKDLMLSETCRITDDPATVAMENVTIAVSEANAIMGAVSTLDIGTALTETGSGVSFTLEELTPVVSLFSSALDMVNVTGTSLTIDLSGFGSGFDEAWQANQYVAISFGQTQDSLDSLAHFDTTRLQVTATYNGESYAVFVNSDAQGSASTLYISTSQSPSAVPEPTTATLSLLALSLLAARRRRR